MVDRRRMFRNFQDRPVPRELMDRIVSNATHAPSAGFSQGWEFLLLEGPEQTSAFWNASFPERSGDFRWQGIFKAPVVLVPLSHKQAYLDRYAESDKGWTDRDESRWPTPFWDVDTAFASMLVLLTVVDCGLGALFFGVTKKLAVTEAFGVPEGYDPIGAIAIGYPAPDEPSPSLKRGRRPPEEVVHRGRW